MNHENRVSKIFANIIALVNSLILFIKSLWDVPGGGGLINYCVILLSFAGLVGSATILVLFIVSYRKEKRKQFKINRKAEISKYLVCFMENAGRTVILSRDLSWITSDFIGRMEEKARQGALLIFVPHPNETAERLKRAGADVRYFGALLSDSADSIIKSRFTIIQWDSHSARLTYPKEDQVYHYNREYAAGDPATDLAQDLIRLLIKLVPEENRQSYPAGQPQPLLPNT